jgi:hypothetical protein
MYNDWNCTIRIFGWCSWISGTKIILYVSLSQAVSFFFHTQLYEFPNTWGVRCATLFFRHVQKSYTSYDFVKRIRIIRFAKIPLWVILAFSPLWLAFNWSLWVCVTHVTCQNFRSWEEKIHWHQMATHHQLSRTQGHNFSKYPIHITQILLVVFTPLQFISTPHHHLLILLSYYYTNFFIRIRTIRVFIYQFV